MLLSPSYIVTLLIEVNTSKDATIGLLIREYNTRDIARMFAETLRWVHFAISIFRRESACCDRVKNPDRLIYRLLMAAKEVSELGAIVVVVNATQCSIRPQRQVSWWLLCLEFRREYVSNFGKLKSLSSLGVRCGCCAAVLYCQSGGRGGAGSALAAATQGHRS